MRSPTNTTAQVNANPIIGLFDAMAGSGGIERSEKRGQQELVASDTLPTDGLDKLVGIPGFKIIKPVPGDDLFSFVELPTGWTKKGTDHNMHSKLCDEKGRERASIFYKAAFYDRKAHISINRRFNAWVDYDHEEKTGETTAIVKDGEATIHRTAVFPGERWKVGDDAITAATYWLDERRPDWANPLAYWDVE